MVLGVPIFKHFFNIVPIDRFFIVLYGRIILSLQYVPSSFPVIDNRLPISLHSNGQLIIVFKFPALKVFVLGLKMRWKLLVGWWCGGYVWRI